MLSSARLDKNYAKLEKMPGMVDLNANVIFNFCFILILEALEGFPFAMWAKTDSTFIMAKQCWGYLDFDVNLSLCPYQKLNLCATVLFMCLSSVSTYADTLVLPNMRKGE